MGCRVLGLHESGWPSTGAAKARGAAGRPPGPTARLRPGSQGAEGLEAAGSLSAPWFPHLSRGSTLLKVQGPLSRAGPEQDRVLDCHGNSVRNPCCSHPTPDSVSSSAG